MESHSSDQLLQIIAPLLNVGKGTVELGFVGAVEELTKVGAGFDAQVYEVTTKEDGFWGVVLDGELGGFVE